MKPSSLPRVGDLAEVHDAEGGKWIAGRVTMVSDRYVTISAAGSTYHIPLHWYRENMGWRFGNHAAS